jgi:hypothetical protein
MGLDGAARGSGLTRWLGLFGAVVLAAGLVTAYGGALRADVSSTWDYCGAGKTIVTVPCRCPERDIQTTWPGEAIVCFSPAPDSAYLMADLGSSAVIVGALLLAVGNLLRLGRVGWTWLVVRSALTVVASARRRRAGRSTDHRAALPRLSERAERSRLCGGGDRSRKRRARRAGCCATTAGIPLGQPVAVAAQNAP